MLKTILMTIALLPVSYGSFATTKTSETQLPPEMINPTSDQNCHSGNLEDCFSHLYQPKTIVYHPINWSIRSSNIKSDIQQNLDLEYRQNRFITSEILNIHAPSLNINKTFTSGFSDPIMAVPTSEKDVFDIGSISKSFNSAAILRLSEDGGIGLDQPISKYLPKSIVMLMTDRGYDPSAITVRHLLTHSSGIGDVPDNQLWKLANLPGYASQINREDLTREEYVERALIYGVKMSAPGTTFSYGDIDPVISQLIIETITGKKLNQAIPLILDFDKLDMSDTYYFTDPRNIKMTNSYIGLVDVSNKTPSDQLLSTTKDLSKFFEGLFEGKVFKKNSTLLEMIKPFEPSSGSEKYGLNIVSETIVYRYGKEICWGHAGYLGSFSYYCPKSKLTVSRWVGNGAVWQSKFDLSAPIVALLNLIHEHNELHDDRSKLLSK